MKVWEEAEGALQVSLPHIWFVYGVNRNSGAYGEESLAPQCGRQEGKHGTPLKGSQ